MNPSAFPWEDTDMKVTKVKREYILDSKFSYSVDASDENIWNKLIKNFSDATVNQTWAYCQIRSKCTSNIILEFDSTIVAMAMVRLAILPILKRGIAYIGSGPIWMIRGQQDNINYLRMILRAIKEEYVIRRRLLLRISPNVFSNYHNYRAVRSVFEEEGFCCNDNNETTFFLDLERSEDDLRKSFHQKWRNLLNRAEKNEFAIRKGTNLELFDVFGRIYNQMLDRKKYETDVDLSEYKRIQEALPSDMRPLIVICEIKGIPMAGGVFSVCGDTGIYLLGATSSEGMKNQASYLVQWYFIKFLKNAGLSLYDLGGCNPKTYRGTYHFKAGICGKNPKLFSRIGVMESCDSLTSRLIVQTGALMKGVQRKIKRWNAR